MADKTAEERIDELEKLVAKLTAGKTDDDDDEKPLSPRQLARQMTPAEAREALRELHKKAAPTNRLRDGLREAFTNDEGDTDDQ